MKALSDILTRMLMLLLLMLVACTNDDADEVTNPPTQEEYVSVRMNIPGMKAAATRAVGDDNITSITALVFRDGELVKKETATELTQQNFKIPKPQSGDVIHFLANLPDNYTLPEIGQDSTALTTLDIGRENLCYWGKYTYLSGDVINTLTLYRSLAMIEIKPDPKECTFPEDSLFIAGLINANQKGTLVPYDTESKAFNFNLDDKDYYTLPENPDPLAKTDSLTNWGAGYESSLYVLEHANPATEEGLYVICKIDKDFYKVALTKDSIHPYPIIRNHKYTIYVKDLDEGCRTYKEALSAKPINLKVIETADVVFNYTNNPTVYLNGGKDATLPVNITVPNNSTLTQLTISAPNFTIKQGETPLEQNNEGIYTYSGEMTGTTGLTFIPKSGLEAGNYPIILSGSGTYLHEFSDTITVTVDASVMGVSAKNDDATLNMDAGDTDVTFVLAKPGNVSSVSVTTNEFNYSVNNGNEYTFTPKSNNIASGTYTITFADSNYSNVVNTTATITVVNTPKVTFSPDDSSKIMSVNDTYAVTMIVPNSGTLTALNIAAEGFTLTASDGTLSGPTDNVYSYTGGTTNFTFTPTSAGSRTIRFYDGAGVDINVPEKQISVTVNAAITAEANSSEVYCDDSTKKNVTVDVVIPKGVSTLNITTEDFTVTQNGNALQPNGNVYTYTNGDATNQQTVQFVFTLKDSVTEPKNQSTITFSDASGNQNQYVVNGIVNITITETQEVTNALTVTPLTSTTIDLTDGGNDTVQLRLTIPDNVSQFMINANEAFTIKVIDNAVGLQNNNGIYYCYDKKSKTTIDLELTMNDQNIFMTAGEYTITISEINNTSNSCSQTIVATNNSLSDGVIWEGSKEAVNSGYILYYTSFIKYKDSDKKLKVDITTTGDGWKQFTIRYKNDYGNSLGALQGQTIDSTLSIDIPAENRDVVISGQGGITITKIYVE